MLSTTSGPLPLGHHTAWGDTKEIAPLNRQREGVPKTQCPILTLWVQGSETLGTLFWNISSRWNFTQDSRFEQV